MKSGYVVAALLLCGATTLRAEEFKHKPSGLQFDLPEGWTCTDEGGRLSIENPEKTLALVGGVIPQENAKAIFADIQKFLDTLDGLNDVKVTEGPKKEKVNGLQQAWYEGTASYKEGDEKTEKVEWDMTIVSGGKGVLFLIGIGKLDSDEQAYEELFESIKKSSSEEE